MDLVDEINQELPDLPDFSGTPPTGVQIALNINPHHNMFSPLNGGSTTEASSTTAASTIDQEEDNDLPDLPQPVMDEFQIDFFDMFRPMREIQNLPDEIP